MSFAESFIRGYTRGGQAKSQREQDAREVEQQQLAEEKFEEDKKRALQEHEMKVRANKINEQMTAVKLATDQYTLKSKTFAPSVPGSAAAGVEQVDPTAYDMQTIPGVAELGVAPTQVRPQYLDDANRNAMTQNLVGMQQKQDVERAPIPLSPMVAAMLTGQAPGSAGLPTEASPTDLAVMTHGMTQRGLDRRNREDNAAAMARTIEGNKPKSTDIDTDNDAAMLLGGGTAAAISVKDGRKAKAVAEARARGGMDGTGFVPENTKQQGIYSDFTVQRNKAMRLKTLLADPEVAKRLGPLMGLVVGMTKEWPIVGQSTAVKEAFDLFKDLSDAELRNRSGAAISPGEYDRVVGFTIDPTKQLDSNATNLDQMLEALETELTIIGATKLPGGTVKAARVAAAYKKKMGL